MCIRSKCHCSLAVEEALLKRRRNSGARLLELGGATVDAQIKSATPKQSTNRMPY